MITKPLRVVFAGTPEFAAIVLEHLLQRDSKQFEIIAVYTQPDRPSGRGLLVHPSPVKKLALARGIPLYQPESLKYPYAQTELESLHADVMVVAAYGLLLPKAVLTIPRDGCINIHPSLLPAFRGAAPIPRSIQEGSRKTGVTIMQMDEGLDTGPLLLQLPYQMRETETAASLHDVMAHLGAKALLQVLEMLQENQALHPITQNHAAASYAHKISKEEATLSFHANIDWLDRTIRAFNPWPLAQVPWQGQMLRIGEAVILANTRPENSQPGTLIAASESGLDIACEDGVLRLLRVQLPGGKMLPLSDFYHARSAQLKEGELFQ